MFAKGLRLKQAIFVTITVLVLTTYFYHPSLIFPGSNRHKQNVKYILLWGDPSIFPFDVMRKGFDAFRDCEFTNCFFTTNRHLPADVREFDVIIFNGKEVDRRYKKYNLPARRSVKQKYIYANFESSHYYPVCSSYFNNFFNWTWTYKMNSDFYGRYIIIYNLIGDIVGPKRDMQWPTLDPIDNKTKIVLKSKSKASAWFVSNCFSLSNREHFGRIVEKKLKKYGLSLDIYGYCGKLECPQKSETCLKMLARDYYFYFSFENSFADDYVTEKVVTALENYAVPVVFGAANYSRYLPPGSYLHAMELGPERLAESMARIITNHRTGDGDEYHSFFRWRNHYKYKDSTGTEALCKLCRMINDESVMSRKTIYSNFTSWWNSEHARCENRSVPDYDNALSQWWSDALQNILNWQFL